MRVVLCHFQHLLIESSFIVEVVWLGQLAVVSVEVADSHVRVWLCSIERRNLWAGRSRIVMMFRSSGGMWGVGGVGWSLVGQ